MLKFSWKLAGLVALGAALLPLSSALVAAELIACVIWAFRGPRQAIQALVVAVFITYANPALVAPSPIGGILARVVLLAAALRVIPLIRTTDLRVLWPVWLFSFIAGVLSWSWSVAPAISIMKVLTFFVAATTVLIAFNRLSPVSLNRLETWLSTLGLVVVGLSILTLAAPGIAFHRTGTGLQGVLGHPQALAVILAPFVAWMLSGLTMIKGRLKLWNIAAVLALCGVMLMTEARTAAVAATAGLGLATWRALFPSRSDIGKASLGRLLAFAAVGVLALGVVVMTTDKVSTAAESFLLKRSGARDMGDAFYQSRGGGILGQWHRFLEKPWTGYGFGVPPNGRFKAGVTMVAGIPISAPVEKGFAFTAVLEENGVLGGIAFFLMILTLGRLAWRSGDPRMMALFGACIFINVGEAVIFAPGGIGLFLWVLLGLTAASARRRRSVPTREQRLQAPMPPPAVVAHGAAG